MENIDKFVELITEKLLEHLKEETVNKRVFFLGESDTDTSLNHVRTDSIEEADVIVIGSGQLSSLLRLSSLSPANPVEESVIEFLLLGKEVYAFDQNFQLGSYKQTSRAFLYKELLQKKDILEKYGVTFYQDGELANLLSDKNLAVLDLDRPKAQQSSSVKKTLITATKLRELGLTDGDSFRIEKGMLVTALALDYLNDHNISIV